MHILHLPEHTAYFLARESSMQPCRLSDNTSCNFAEYLFEKYVRSRLRKETCTQNGTWCFETHRILLNVQIPFFYSKYYHLFFNSVKTYFYIRRGFYIVALCNLVIKV